VEREKTRRRGAIERKWRGARERGGKNKKFIVRRTHGKELPCVLAQGGGGGVKNGMNRGLFFFQGKRCCGESL